MEDNSCKFVNNIEICFALFCKELDAKHDLYEKIVKVSRDITIESKRSIFLLHRISVGNLEGNFDLVQAKEKLSLVVTKFKQIAYLVKGLEALQFLKAFSPGLQEFIEAKALLTFLETYRDVENNNISKCILSKDDIQCMLTFQLDTHDKDNNLTKIAVPVPVEEYLLGIADVTGECMRMCINASTEYFGKSDFSSSLSYKLCSYVQELHTDFSLFVELLDISAGQNKVFGEKMRTIVSNVKKCEDVCYTLKVRGKEITQSLLKAAFIATSKDG